MVKIVLYTVIIAIVLSGMATISMELIRHFKLKKRMTKPSMRWKLILLLIGCSILIDKAQYLLGLH